MLLGAFPVYCIRAYAVAVGVLPCASGENVGFRDGRGSLTSEADLDT